MQFTDKLNLYFLFTKLNARYYVFWIQPTQTAASCGIAHPGFHYAVPQYGTRPPNLAVGTGMPAQVNFPHGYGGWIPDPNIQYAYGQPINGPQNAPQCYGYVPILPRNYQVLYKLFSVCKIFNISMIFLTSEIFDNLLNRRIYLLVNLFMLLLVEDIANTKAPVAKCNMMRRRKRLVHKQMQFDVQSDAENMSMSKTTVESKVVTILRARAACR